MFYMIIYDSILLWLSFGFSSICTCISQTALFSVWRLQTLLLKNSFPTAGFLTYWVKSIAMLLNLRNAERIFSFVICFWNSSLPCVFEVQVQVSTLFNKTPLLFRLFFGTCNSIEKPVANNEHMLLQLCNQINIYFILLNNLLPPNSHYLRMKSIVHYLQIIFFFIFVDVDRPPCIH